MIQFIPSPKINTDKWNTALKSAYGESIYGHAWYLDAFCYWEALVVDDYRIVIPIPFRKRFGISYVYVPRFCQTLGVFSTDKIDSELASELLNALSNRYRFVDIALANLDLNPSFAPVSNRNVEMSLAMPYDSLFQNFSSNTKRNIRKSVKSNSTFSLTTDPEKIINAYLENKAKEVGAGISGDDLKQLRAIVEAGLKHGALSIIEAYDDTNTFLGGAIFVASFSRYVFLFSGLTDAGKRDGAMFGIVNWFIKEHAAESMVLDFEGSNADGVARFYLGFGGIETTYYRIRLNNLPRMLRWLKK